MNTQISFTFNIDSRFQKNLDLLKGILNGIAAETTSKKSYWGMDMVGIMILALGFHDGDNGYYKLRKPKYKKSFTQKNPLRGDQVYDGYCELEYRFSDRAYAAWVNLDAESFVVLKEELDEMLSKLEFLKDKCPEFNFEDFRSTFLEAYDGVTNKVKHECKNSEENS